MRVGVLQVELHLPMAMSLKDKRSALKGLKDQLHGRFNVAVADLDPNEKWQRASLGAVTIGGDRASVEGCLRRVVEWMEQNRFVEVVRVEQEFW